MTRTIARSMLMLSVSLAAMSPALAQTAPDPAEAGATAASQAPGTEARPAPVGPSEENGEIVVTALRRESTVQSTPLAITALGEGALANLGATTIADVIRQVPGLQLTESDSGRTRVSIRGIQGAGESTVGLYYGDTPLTGPSGVSSDPAGATPNLNLFDVQRVEVLRGPQGTLYGSGSMGGTIRVLFNQPDATRYEGQAEGQIANTRYGTYSYFAKGAVNAPLIEDKLAARLVLYKERQGGFVDMTVLNRENVNTADLEGGRFLMSWKPVEDVKLSGMALYQTQNIAGTSQYSSVLGPYFSDIQVNQPWKDKLQLYTGTAEVDFGFATLVAITSKYRWDVESTNDNVRSYANVIARGTWCPLYTRIALGTPTTTCTPAQQAAYRTYANSKQPIGAFQPRFVSNWTNEARLSSTGKGPISWTIGMFLEDREDRVDTVVFPGVPATGDPRSPVENLGGRYITGKVKQTAFFGEAGFRVLDPLTITVGLRHYDYTKTVGGEYLGYNFFNGQEPRPYQETSADATGWVGKFNVDFQVTDNLLLYGTAAEGFRPGGANNIPNLPEAYLVYGPDSLWNYEIGAKTSFWDRRGTFNVALYRTDWKNVQTSVSTLQNGGGNFSFIYNLAGVTVEGVEVEGSLRLPQNVRLNASYNYNNARLRGDQVDATGFIVAPGLDGDKLTYIPRMTASAGAEWTPPVTDEIDALFRFDWAYTGKMNTELRPVNAFYREIGNFSIFNARVGIDTDSNLGVAIFINNVFDKRGLNRVSSATGVPDFYVSNRPRTVGLNIRKGFR